jgi:hypothetical protein
MPGAFFLGFGSFASGSDRFGFGVAGDLGIEANIPPGVFIAEAIPPPGVNKEHAVGDNQGNTIL